MLTGQKSASLILSLLIFAFICCSQENEYGRLGIEVPVGNGKISKETPFVIHAVYDGPAYRAGIHADDVIIQIDDVPLRKGMTHDYVYKKLLLGKPNTKVTLVVDRNGERLVFDVIRAGQ